MNPWVKKSIKLAKTTDYLDRLHEVYPVGRPEFRTLDNTLMQQIIAAHGQSDPVQLVSTLMRLKKFPLDDPYLGFLKEDKEAIKRNIATVRRIGESLLMLPPEQILAMCRQPKRAVKQFGPAFKRWWLNLPYIKAHGSKFESLLLGGDEIVIHDGTPKDWKRFANTELDCGLVREPDVLAKKGKQFVVGEAKFLTAFGGGQDDKFDEAMELIRQVHGRAHRIAVLDGPLWLHSNKKQSREVRNIQTDAMSALLLREFLDTF